jgi:superfamily II RNA helicase
MAELLPLDRLAATGPTDGDGLELFLEWVVDRGLELYPAQETAVLEIFDGRHVVLETPTGSGKSLVALAAHVAALARGERSFYTAPIKALVSEKFFELCRQLGAERVGMITGDAAVNPDAPVICCTAEILADLALRQGRRAAVHQVCMDEFHYYGDAQRGTAWQVPLLELTDTRFLLMSATLGDTRRLREDLEARTSRPVVLVRSGERPVPLSFEYRETLLLDTLQELLDTDRAPVYLVHFTQASATERAQALTSLGILSKAERAAVSEAIGDFRFDSPFGKDLARFVRHGIGVHHAGLLPKYRLLVEKLAQQGLLKVICGTDTLGVGVNVPIRTVLFTQLCKYDGRETRILTVREFQQIAGRAGRRGFDTEGFVWAQAPEHVAENKRAEEKATADAAAGKKRKVVKRKAPDRGYKAWNRDTFGRLVEGRPETLESSFQVSHATVLQMLDRPGDGCADLRRLLVDNHEPRTRQRAHVRRAIHLYRSLLAAGVIETLDEPDHLGRRVRIHGDLQTDFRLDRPLAPFALDVLSRLDPEHEEYALQTLSVVESVLDDPTAVLLRQLDRAKDELMARLKEERVEYEERMEQLAKVEWPKPLAAELYELFGRFRDRHPWVGQENVRPKSVARDLYERSLTFREYVNEYGLKRSEGLLLRYLSEAYKTLVQMVPEQIKTDAVLDLTEWLGTIVRQVDASLIEEWERLRSGVVPATIEEAIEAEVLHPPDVTANRRSFRILVANELFRWVQHLARREEDRLVDALDDTAGEGRTGGWTADELRQAMEPYWEQHDGLGTGPDARSPRHVQVTEGGAVGSGVPAGEWRVRQALADPEGWYEWHLVARVDLELSRTEGRPVLALESISSAA